MKIRQHRQTRRCVHGKSFEGGLQAYFFRLVRDDVEVTAGWQVLGAGQEGRMPVETFSSAGVSELSFNLDYRGLNHVSEVEH